ncbi:hypothetical protein [Pseudomonas lini]|uniref:hypothetical protein n=1 Tax=Pseudomonas lini TaxID=163011 RepID=UPI000B03FF91|nr:hypothetical protein [Pseudomonas lini]
MKKPRSQPVEVLDQLARLGSAEIREFVAASRIDPRPAIDSETVFAVLDALIHEIETEQSCP